MRKRKKKKKEKGKPLLAKFRHSRTSNISMLISCASVIMVWRGIWDICDTFVFPKHHVLSDLICLIIGIIVLLLDDGKLKELA